MILLSHPFSLFSWPYSLFCTLMPFLCPLLNTSWPLNLMPWCSLSCTLLPLSWELCLSQGLPVHQLSHSLFLTSCPALSFPLPHSLSFLCFALSPPFSWPRPFPHKIILTVSPVCTLTFLHMPSLSWAISLLHTISSSFSFSVLFTRPLSLLLNGLMISPTDSLSYWFSLHLLLLFHSVSWVFPLMGTLASIHLLCCAYSFSKAIPSFLVPVFLF